MAIKCPYCDKKLKGVKAVYGHWSHCREYKDFIKKHGKEARRPFKWIGYTQRHPKNWIDKQPTQKPIRKQGASPSSKSPHALTPPLSIQVKNK